MHVQRYTHADDFYTAVQAFMMQDEAANILPIGLCTNIIANPSLFVNPYFAAAIDDGEIVGATMRTLPYNLIVVKTESEAAIAALIDDVAQVYDTLRGIIGTTANSALAVRLWEARSPQRGHIHMPERVYQLTRVVPPNPPVPGTLRKATADDRDLLFQWLYNFQVDAIRDQTVDVSVLERNLNNALTTGSRTFYFWEVEGQPVAMAGYTGFTPNGVRIGPVYTPTDQRRKGYGSAVTAALSQLLLDGGRKYCFLFTDLNNPTSNHIYQTIGYEPVCDMDEWRFE